jgi:alpha-galactosidase/6-phospho-beta-glucosidase family protein
MTQSMHDLRLALRDSAKQLEDAENATNTLRTDYDNQLRKKDEVISMKESIIKEKDAYILKLEEEISKHDPTFVASTGLNNGMITNSSPRTSLLEVPSPTKQQRTKRTAISAEPAQHKKSKDLRVVLQAFDKSDR